MHQNGGAFHAANGMLNKDTDLTQGCIGSLLCIAQWRVGVLFTLARLLGRDVNAITPVVSFACPESLNRPRTWRSANQSNSGGNSCFNLLSSWLCPLNVRPRKMINFSGRDMTVFLSLCLFFAAGVLPLFGVLCRTTIGTFGGVNDHLIHPFQSRFQSVWGAQLAIRHPC